VRSSTSPVSATGLAAASPLRLDEVYRELAPRVARWVRRLGCPPDEIEDVVHDIFLTVQRLLPGFRGESKLSTWVFAITRSAVRARRRRDRLRRLFLGKRREVADLEVVPVSTPCDEFERAQGRAVIARALDRMSERLRTVFVLFEIERLSGEEIAELTGTRVSTVWVQIHRAREQFRRHLEALRCDEGAT
jgi:RNA polymerase sigma-70 factor (ECF subfamily)